MQTRALFFTVFCDKLRKNEPKGNSMTLQQLRYVTAVADARTISKAAQKFYISQPSLTNSIHELEQELGLTIFTAPTGASC